MLPHAIFRLPNEPGDGTNLMVGNNGSTNRYRRVFTFGMSGSVELMGGIL
jgi:hypothetical protein